MYPKILKIYAIKKYVDLYLLFIYHMGGAGGVGGGKGLAGMTTYIYCQAQPQLNSISTQTKKKVSLIPTFPSHPPMTVVSMEV